MPKRKAEMTIWNWLDPFQSTVQEMTKCKDNWENLIAAMREWVIKNEIDIEYLSLASLFIHAQHGEMLGIKNCLMTVAQCFKTPVALESMGAFEERRKEWKELNETLKRVKLCEDDNQLRKMFEHRLSDHIPNGWRVSYDLRDQWVKAFRVTQEVSYALIKELVAELEKKDGRS